VRSFESNFLNLVDSIRRDTGYPELPFLYVQICRYNLQNLDYGVYWETAREIQRTATGKRKSLWMVSSVDVPMDDLAHVSESGQDRLGRRLAEVALTHVYGLKDHGTPIDYLSCEMLPSDNPLHHSLRVRFSGVTGRLQAPGRVAGFEIRSDDPKRDGPVVYKAELDPNDPAAVLVWYSKEITSPVRLYYAPGLVPYVNLTDSLDMGMPGFGPVTIEPRR
jgi:sialate O-acetylesterase